MLPFKGFARVSPDQSAPGKSTGKRNGIVALVVISVLVVVAAGLLANSTGNSQTPMVVSIQTLVNAYSNPNDIQCIANAKCPSEDVLYKDKSIQTTGVTDSADIWTGPTWDSSVGEYFVSLHAPNGGFRSVVVYFAKDSVVTSNGLGAGMNLTVVGTFVGLQPSQTGCCLLRIQDAKLVTGSTSQNSATPSVTAKACGPAEAGSCGI